MEVFRMGFTEALTELIGSVFAVDAGTIIGAGVAVALLFYIGDKAGLWGKKK